METLRKLQQKLTSSERSGYDRLGIPEQLSSGKMDEACYEASRTSNEAQTPLQPDPTIYYHRQPRQRLLNITTALLAVALVVLSFFHVLLILKQHPVNDTDHRSPGGGWQTTDFRQWHTTDCGSSKAEAKAKNCWWDEMTKYWMPPECPNYLLDDYHLMGMLHNHRENATSWPYFWDQEAKSELNFVALSEDETVDPKTKFYSTTRQHLAHCAFVLRRTLWAFENGYGHFSKFTRMHHVDHCVDALYRRATIDDATLDEVGIVVDVGFGTCTFQNSVGEKEFS